MASPQVEDGYVRIANELLAALCRSKLSGPEFMVALTVITKTYGWNKTKDQISLSTFEKFTLMNKPRIIRAIRALVTRMILGSITGDTRSASTYWIIKDYDKWNTLPSNIQGTTRIVTTPSNESTLQLVTNPIYLTKDNKDKRTPGPQKARPETPSLNTVLLYLKERGSPVDGEAFHAYYSANGWVQGRGKPIKSWKAAIVTWEKNENKFNSNNKQENKWGI